MTFHRWLYRDGHPDSIAKLVNKGWALLHALGVSPNWLVTLEVTGRQSGKAIRFPLVMAVVDNERYLVSMLGKDANWVKNLAAAGGKARLIHGVSEEVHLEEVDVDRRAPIIKEYLKAAPGARAHIPVDKDAPLLDFEEIASQYPVFKLKTIKNE